MRKRLPLQKRQWFGYSLGTLLGLSFLTYLFLPGKEKLHARGPMMVGHEDLQCLDCHVPAEGSFRQQVQANIQHWLGKRRSGADFGSRKVDNRACLDCHDRPNDRHPVFRFVEPRFQEARENIQPHQCISCHREHSGKNITIKPTFCSECHENLVMKSDPVDTPHAALIADKRWDSCLGCHDFHGNHEMDLKERVAEVFTAEQIRDYFDGGPSPYAETRIYLAKKEKENE